MQRVSAARLQAQHRPQSSAAGDARRHPAPAAKLPLFHGMHVELLAGAAGMIICAVFMLSPSSPPTPLPVALGMLFTNGVCPVLLALAPAFYRRHRTAVVLLARIAFMHGTLHVWHEERPWQRGSMGWPALLLTLAYSSRALVACWGALGWQLPLPWHVVVQGLHVSLAGWRLAPAVCGAAGALRGNSSKLQTLALLLDWPLHVMGGPPFLMPAPGACLALIVWTQVLVAFIVPTAVLLSLQHRRRARRSVATSAPSLPAAPAPVPLAALAAAAPAPRAGRLRPPDPALLAEDEWSIPAVSCFAAQMLWLLLRVTLQDASA